MEWDKLYREIQEECSGRAKKGLGKVSWKRNVGAGPGKVGHVFTCQERKEEDLRITAPKERQGGAWCIWGNDRKLERSVIGWGMEYEKGWMIRTVLLKLWFGDPLVFLKPLHRVLE